MLEKLHIRVVNDLARILCRTRSAPRVAFPSQCVFLMIGLVAYSLVGCASSQDTVPTKHMTSIGISESISALRLLPLWVDAQRITGVSGERAKLNDLRIDYDVSGNMRGLLLIATMEHGQEIQISGTRHPGAGLLNSVTVVRLEKAINNGASLPIVEVLGAFDRFDWRLGEGKLSAKLVDGGYFSYSLTNANGHALAEAIPDTTTVYLVEGGRLMGVGPEEVSLRQRPVIVLELAHMAAEGAAGIVTSGGEPSERGKSIGVKYGGKEQAYFGFAFPSDP